VQAGQQVVLTEGLKDYRVLVFFLKQKTTGKCIRELIMLQHQKNKGDKDYEKYLLQDQTIEIIGFYMHGIAFGRKSRSAGLFI
jgi:hypothetical protein